VGGIRFLTCRNSNETGNGTVKSLNNLLSTKHEEGSQVRGGDFLGLSFHSHVVLG